MIKLQHGDCLELMKSIPDGSVDMVLCDLPYGATQNSKDKPLPFPDLWREYKRVVKKDGCIALFAQGLFYIDLVNSNRKMFRYDLIWDKVLTSGFLNAKRLPLRRHEQIAIFYRKKPTYNPQFTTGKPLHSKGTAYLSKSTGANRNYGKYTALEDERKGSTQKYPTSIIPFQKPHPRYAKHETQKSVALCEWLIKTYTNEGDLVLDNCMGSGTTGVACVRTGRNFIGIEIDSSTYETAQREIQEAQYGK